MFSIVIYINISYPMIAPKIPNSDTKSTSSGGDGPPGRII